MRLIERSFQRLGLQRLDEGIADTSFIISPLRRVEGYQLADGAKPICASTYLADMRTLCERAGHTGKISSKSPKVAGTSACYAAGMSTLDCQTRGRWNGERTSLHYRQATPAYRARIGTAISMFKPGRDVIGREEEEGVQQQGRGQGKRKRRRRQLAADRARKKKQWYREVREETGPARQHQLGKRHRRDRSLVRDHREQQRLDELQPIIDERDELLMRQEELLADRNRFQLIYEQMEQEQVELVRERGQIAQEKARLEGAHWRLKQQIRQQQQETDQLRRQLNQKQGPGRVSARKPSRPGF